MIELKFEMPHEHVSGLIERYLLDCDAVGNREKALERRSILSEISRETGISVARVVGTIVSGTKIMINSQTTDEALRKGKLAAWVISIGHKPTCERVYDFMCLYMERLAIHAYENSGNG